MLRLGIADCDTSHVYHFARRLNHVDIEPEHWVNGAAVVAAFVGESRVTAPDRVAEYVAAMRETGVELVDRPEDLLGRVDAVLIESNDGSIHRERATPFIEAGLPVFVDKPLALTTADARALVDLAALHSVPLISASSLRFAPAAKSARAGDSVGTLLGADVYGPAWLHDVNPGLFHYGVHGVELLYTLLGPGCREVTCTFDQGGEIVTGRWSDQRLGVLRGLRRGAIGYGGTLYGASEIRTLEVDQARLYSDLLAEIVPVLEGKPSPITGAELVEVVAFQEAALASARADGQPVRLDL